MAGNILGTQVFYDADCNLQALVGKKLQFLATVPKVMRMH